jgi:hypothetical protein
MRRIVSLISLLLVCWSVPGQANKQKRRAVPPSHVAITHPKTILPDVRQNLTNYRVARQLQRWVRLTVKVVYAYTRSRKKIDPRLKRDLPVLNGMFDFNVYRLRYRIVRKARYKQRVTISISPRYRVSFLPTQYDPVHKKIAIRAFFLRKKRVARRKRRGKRFKQYATTSFRLQEGGKLAIMGPAYRYGRSLLILSAHHIQKRTK